MLSWVRTDKILTNCYIIQLAEIFLCLQQKDKWIFNLWPKIVMLIESWQHSFEKKYRTWGNYFPCITQLKIIAFYTVYAIKHRFSRPENKWKVIDLVARMSTFQNNFKKSLNYHNIIKSEDFWRVISKEFEEEAVFQDWWIFYFPKSVCQENHDTSRNCRYAQDSAVCLTRWCLPPYPTSRDSNIVKYLTNYFIFAQLHSMHWR